MAEIVIFDRTNQELLDALSAGDRSRVDELVESMIAESEFESIAGAVWESVVERLTQEMRDVIDAELSESDRRVRRVRSR